MTHPSNPTENVLPYGPRFAAAMALAYVLHFDQVRKGNGAPYITHPLAVAALVGEYGGDEDQAIAALLHDTMEDCGMTAEALTARYGAAVADMVVHCTDTTDRPKPPWRSRKEAFVQRARSLPARSKLVVAADKLHNVQSILRDLRRRSVGEQVWRRFKASRPDQLWYFHAIVDALADGWHHELLDELRQSVAELD